jgi:hypothetical protein
MPKQTLVALANANKPLVEVSIALVKDANAEAILDDLNELADDFEASLSVYCKMTGKKDLLTIDATPEALQRLFGWEIKRVNLERWNQETQKYEGVWEDTYRWEEINRPLKFPKCLEGKVVEIGLSQPGTNDHGQPYP